MKIKQLWFSFCTALLFFSNQCGAVDDFFGNFSSGVTSRLGLILSSATGRTTDDSDTKLPDCFRRMNYTPKPYYVDNGSLSPFDLSEQSVIEMEQRYQYFKSIESTDIAVIPKKNDIIMDLCCQLGKEGYAPVFWDLYRIFEEGKYGQKKNRELSYLFHRYAVEVGTIKELREAQKISKDVMRRRAEWEAAQQELKPRLSDHSTDSDLSDGSVVEERKIGTEERESLLGSPADSYSNLRYRKTKGDDK